MNKYGIKPCNADELPFTEKLICIECFAIYGKPDVENGIATSDNCPQCTSDYAIGQLGDY